mmetsp:Transcript_10098/g.25258  ORF Transcript_10098/g.25258 Transcript_10098/m.25258 type:complete len:373 (+) Transcript_10098:15-1133(+)
MNDTRVYYFLDTLRTTSLNSCRLISTECDLLLVAVGLRDAQLAYLAAMTIPCAEEELVCLVAEQRQGLLRRNGEDHLSLPDRLDGLGAAVVHLYRDLGVVGLSAVIGLHPLQHLLVGEVRREVQEAHLVPHPEVGRPLGPVNHRAAAVKRSRVHRTVRLLTIEQNRIQTFRIHSQLLIALIGEGLLPGSILEDLIPVVGLGLVRAIGRHFGLEKDGLSAGLHVAKVEEHGSEAVAAACGRFPVPGGGDVLEEVVVMSDVGLTLLVVQHLQAVSREATVLLAQKSKASLAQSFGHLGVLDEGVSTGALQVHALFACVVHHLGVLEGVALVGERHCVSNQLVGLRLREEVTDQEHTRRVGQTLQFDWLLGWRVD